MQDPFVPLVMWGVVVVLKLCSCIIPSPQESRVATGCHTLRERDTFIAAHWAWSILCSHVWSVMASIQSTRPLTSLSLSLSPHANGCIWGPWTRTDSCSLPLIRIAANDLQTKSWAIFVKECFKSEGTHSKFRIEIRVPCGILIEYEATIKQH